MLYFFFFNYTATTEIYPLSLHDALPISVAFAASSNAASGLPTRIERPITTARAPSRSTSVSRRSSITPAGVQGAIRSEEHTSELQSRQYLVCRLLLEKKKTISVSMMDT